MLVIIVEGVVISVVATAIWTIIVRVIQPLKKWITKRLNRWPDEFDY